MTVRTYQRFQVGVKSRLPVSLRRAAQVFKKKLGCCQFHPLSPSLDLAILAVPQLQQATVKVFMFHHEELQLQVFSQVIVVGLNSSHSPSPTFSPTQQIAAHSTGGWHACSRLCLLVLDCFPFERPPPSTLCGHTPRGLHLRKASRGLQGGFKGSWRGLEGGVSCFYSFGEPLTHGLTQCLPV